MGGRGNSRLSSPLVNGLDLTLPRGDVHPHRLLQTDANQECHSPFHGGVVRYIGNNRPPPNRLTLPNPPLGFQRQPPPPPSARPFHRPFPRHPPPNIQQTHPHI